MPAPPARFVVPRKAAREPWPACQVGWPLVRPLRLTFLAAILLLFAAPALAATVALVRPARPSPDATEALSRLHGELLSIGLEVTMADSPAGRVPGGSDSRAWLEAMAARRGAQAIVEVVDGAPLAVDVWVMDRDSQGFEVARVALEPDTDKPVERLAIRAVEVLRASFLESDLLATKRRPEPGALPPEPTLSQEGTRQPDRHAERVGVELGAAALAGLDGIGPAILPLVRVGAAAGSWLEVQTTLAGLGSRPTVAGVAGRARIAQQYALLGGRVRLHSHPWVRPFVAVAAGVLRTSVDGQADPPKQAHAVVRWSFLLDGSAGAELRLHGRYYLTPAAHVQMAAPYVAVHFLDEVVATSGLPNLLLTLTLGARL